MKTVDDKTRRKVIKGIFAAGISAVAGCESSRRIETAVKPLSRLIDGKVLSKGNGDYEKWRQAMVWQMLKPSRFPDFIVRPESVSDIQKTIQYAGKNKLKVAVKSGGHHVWASFLRDRGILLDLSRFKQFKVNKNLASIGPALWARDLMTGLQDHGLAFPVAHCATVPLGGYLLGGGLGLNGDEWGGVACNAIHGVDVVTPDGEFLQATESHNSDLLWAARGGGMAFPGIVTGFHVKTFPKPNGVWTSTYVFPLSASSSIATFLDDIAATTPGNTELLTIMVHNPQAPADAPLSQQKACAVRVQVFAKDEVQAKQVLNAVDANPIAQDAVFKIPFAPTNMENLFVESMDWRRGFGFGRFGVENIWSDNIANVIDALAKNYPGAPSWKSHVVIQPKIKKMINGAGAFSRADRTYVGVYSVWDDANADKDNLNWLDHMATILQPYAKGHYINETNVAEHQERAKNSFSASAWNQLRNLRQDLDPHSVLHDLPGIS